MYKKSKRKLFGVLILSLIMTLTTGVYAYAKPVYNDEEAIYKSDEIADISSDLQKEEYKILIAEEITGVLSDSNLENLFYNAELDSVKRNLNSDIFPKLQNVSFTVFNDNILSFNSELAFNETNICELFSTGKVYTSDEGTLRDKVFLVDMDNSDDYHFVQMRINANEEKQPSISIIIQSILTEELLYFEAFIESQVLAEISDIADYMEKEIFFRLYNVGKNLINPVEQSTLIVRVTGDNSYLKVEAFVNGEGENIAREIEVDNTTGSTNLPLAVAYNNWGDFFRELDRYGYAYLDEHNIDRHVITKNGRQHVSKKLVDLILFLAI